MKFLVVGFLSFWGSLALLFADVDIVSSRKGNGFSEGTFIEKRAEGLPSTTFGFFENGAERIFWQISLGSLFLRAPDDKGSAFSSVFPGERGQALSKMTECPRFFSKISFPFSETYLHWNPRVEVAPAQDSRFRIIVHIGDVAFEYFRDSERKVWIDAFDGTVFVPPEKDEIEENKWFLRALKKRGKLDEIPPDKYPVTFSISQKDASISGVELEALLRHRQKALREKLLNSDPEFTSEMGRNAKEPTACGEDSFVQDCAVTLKEFIYLCVLVAIAAGVFYLLRKRRSRKER